MKGMLHDALEAFFTSLETNTLADLLPKDRPRKLATLLHID